MPSVKKFKQSMEKRRIPTDTIKQILDVEYQKDSNKAQDNANFFAKAMQRCEDLLGFDLTAKIMFQGACCKSGYRLENAKKLNKEHGNKTLIEKLTLLGTLQYMGHPYINEDGDIVSEAIGSQNHEKMTCPCWNFNGCMPVDERMPLSYCLCCAGHFMFHYQKALGAKLRVKKVISSILNSQGAEPCVFIYEIVK